MRFENLFNMNLRTELKLAVSPNQINHNHTLLCVGSCFSVNIGNKLIEDKFRCTVNPYGTLYNPISIIKNLNGAINSIAIDQQKIVQRDSLFYHFDFHSDICADSISQLSDDIINIQNQTRESLSKADYLILTFGSSYVFRYHDHNFIVANCHKIDNQKFSRILLDKKAIVDDFNELIVALKKFNQHLKIILTVSPVRHMRDGLIFNNLSKSILIQACHELKDTHEQIEYFPSYELVLDDLRDYRFYKEDLIHPSDLAINYIYDKFSYKYFDSKTTNNIQKIKKIIQAIRHKPFKPNSPEHQIFIQKQVSIAEQLSDQIGIDFTTEINQLKSFVLN